MNRIVMCIDSGSACLEETKQYLAGHDCKVYALSEEQDIRALVEQIDREEGRLDILLLSAGERIPRDGTIGEKHDCGMLLEILSGQINRTQEAIDAALPLLRRGECKRIGMITKRDSSISCCEEDSNYGQHMTWAGLNMMGKLYFNLLRPEGFTFRWYCAEEGSGGMTAGEYLLGNLCYDAKEPYIHSDENRLVMRDAFFREVAW